MKTKFSEIPHQKVSYDLARMDDRWTAKRDEIINRDRGICVLCQDIYDNRPLHVHHTYYTNKEDALDEKEDPWNYPNFSLFTLCNRCHEHVHNEMIVPVLDRYYMRGHKNERTIKADKRLYQRDVNVAISKFVFINRRRNYGIIQAILNSKR